MQTRRNVIIIHYGELGLKGRNQPQFRRQLRQNIQHALGRAGVSWIVKDHHAYYSVPIPEADAERSESVLSKLREVCGVVWLAHAVWLPRTDTSEIRSAGDFVALTEELLQTAVQKYSPGKSFCVRLNRVDKSLPFTSPELEAQFGAIIQAQTEWKTVSLKRPDVTFQIDVSHRACLLFTDKWAGPGGLPVGIAGRVLLLLSGGIDSPVAAYLMAKRGCTMDFIHFTASFISEEEARQSKIFRIARRLTDFSIRSRLWLAPYTYFDMALLGKKVDYQLMLFRRFMARVAEELAHRINAEALVSGDNLSQVASQTLSNLVSASQATAIPVFRPVLGLDKEEIVQIAQRIGTYQESVAPYKDCCALISQNPRTRSKHETLACMEAELIPDYQALVEKTLAEAVCLDVPGGEVTVQRNVAFASRR